MQSTHRQKLPLTAERQHGGKAGLKQTQKVTVAMRSLGNATASSTAQEAVPQQAAATNDGVIDEVLSIGWKDKVDICLVRLKVSSCRQ